VRHTKEEKSSAQDVFLYAHVRIAEHDPTSAAVRSLPSLCAVLPRPPPSPPPPWRSYADDVLFTRVTSTV
jgi:hypothetical protein